MVEIKVGSWWFEKHTSFIVKVLSVMNDRVVVLFDDGSCNFQSTEEFLENNTHLPHCTGFGWVPAPRWFVNNTGNKKFNDGTLVVEQDQYGKVFAHSAEGRSDELKAYQDGTLDNLVRRQEWREIPEPEAAAILEKARKKDQYPKYWTPELPAENAYIVEYEEDVFFAVKIDGTETTVPLECVTRTGRKELTKEQAEARIQKPTTKPCYYQKPSGFKNGTLFRLRDTDGMVWSILSGGQKRLHGKWQEHHDRYVAQGLWVEVTEDFVNRTLSAEFPEKSDFPTQENSPKQETTKPTFWHVKLGNGDVSTYYGSTLDGNCVMLIRREEHGMEPGTMMDFGGTEKFPKLQADDILIEGSPMMFGILSRAIGLCASKTALRRDTAAKTCSGCGCGA